MPRRLRCLLGILAVYFIVLIVLLSTVSHVTLPGEAEPPMQPSGGGLGAASHELLGRPVLTDFLVDYASASALRHDVDAYGITGPLTVRVGLPWEVQTANPHPPTLVAMVLPFTVVRYTWALAAWALAMVMVLVFTLGIAGVRVEFALAIGIGLALTFPGAYGIGNPVSLASWKGPGFRQLHGTT